jgi:hypothetical protein
MDPDLTLKMIRSLVGEINETFDKEDGWPLTVPDNNRLKGQAYDLAVLVEALDEWLAKGGHAPAEWG